MRVETNPYGWSPVDHMNARRAAKPASGGKNYASGRVVNKAAERERLAGLNPFEIIRENAYYRFAAIRAEAREAFRRLRSDYRPEDDIPF